MQQQLIESSQFESAVGTWLMSKWAPRSGDALEGAIVSIWDFEGTLEGARERGFPDGKIRIVVQLDEPHRAVNGIARDPFPAVCVDGLQTTSTTIQAPDGRCRVLALELRPEGALALLGSCLRDLTDRCVDLTAVMGGRARELAERLASARTGSERVAAAEGWARNYADRSTLFDETVSNVARKIVTGNGAVPVAALDDLSGKSRSRFVAAFRDRVGVGPKRYARIVRFRRTLELVRTSRLPLAEIAGVAGYCDQAHLHSEFREHAGLTPREYARALRYPDSVNLVEPGP